MQDRNAAIDVLKQAREALLARMTETILEQQDEILADAHGESFLSEIDELFDRMGAKLSHLNQMISNLPAESPEPVPFEEPAERSDSAENVARLPYFEAAVREEISSDSGIISLPGPNSKSMPPNGFAQFVAHVDAGSLDEAADLIAALLGLSPIRGQKAARTFAQKYQEDSLIVGKAMQIRHQLVQQNYNDALMLTHECFGLQGAEAMIAMQKMREMVSPVSKPNN